MNELKKLTLKYFFQQKWREMKTPLKIIFSTIAIIILTMGVLYDNLIALIILGVGFAFVVLYGLFCLLHEFCKWIKSNWQTATESAIHELNDDQLIYKDLGVA